MTRKTRKRKYCPTLRFSPYAWAKLLFLRDQGPTEIGGFGIAREGDPLFIEDVALVQQLCTAVTVRFDDAAVADFFDEQIDQGRPPEEFARVWIHTHPGDSAAPSWTDERTLSRVFGHCDWAVMCILAKGGQSFARLRFNTGPRADVPIHMEVDWSPPFAGADSSAWLQEYQTCVRSREPFTEVVPETGAGCLADLVHDQDEETGELVEQDLWDAAFW